MANINYRAIKFNPYKHDVDTTTYFMDLDEDNYITYFITFCDRGWHFSNGDRDLYDRAKRYKEDKLYEDDEEITTLDALNALGEGEFVVRVIRGCRQGDYAHLYIDKKNVGMTDYIEALFFNTGTEVMVKSLGENCPLWFYTEKYRDEDILKEAADRADCSIDEIELLNDGDPRASERFTSDEYQDFEEAKAGIATSDLVNLLTLLEEKGIEDERMIFLKKAVSDLKTDKFCPHCGEMLYKSDLPQYRYVCPECEENFFDIEV